MVVVSERIEFSKPKLTVRAMKVDVDKTEGFTCRPAGKIGLDGGALVDDHGRAVNEVGGSRRTTGVGGGDPGMDQCDDTSSSGISGRKVNRVRCEDLLQRGEVVVRGGTNILRTDNVVSLKQRLEMRNDFVVTSYQTTREGEAARVDVRGDNRGEPERRGIVGSSVRGG
jgi:hypothetical protein